MYFFHGKLGVYERMMTEKPGFYRRAGKSGKDGSQKKPYSKKQDKTQKHKKARIKTMNEMLKRLMLVELRKQGFTQARYDSEKDAVLPTPDFPKIEMRENEIWFPREEPKYVLGEKFQTREE